MTLDFMTCDVITYDVMAYDIMIYDIGRLGQSDFLFGSDVHNSNFGDWLSKEVYFRSEILHRELTNKDQGTTITVTFVCALIIQNLKQDGLEVQPKKSKLS